MKKGIPKNHARWLVSVCLLLSCLMLYTATAGAGAVGGILNLLTMPLQKAGAALFGSVNASAEEAAVSKEELLSERGALTSQVNELTRKLADYDRIKKENEEYKKYLGIKDEHPDFGLLSAAVIARDPDDPFCGFTIDQGSLSGVSKNDPVVTDAGLVGWVSEVWPTSSRVTALFHPDARFGARDGAARESGVADGSLRLQDGGLLRLSYLPENTAVEEGDLIVTSGLAVESGFGGLFPRGLVVGTVLSVKHSASDASLYAEVKPAADLKTARDVMVITAFEGKGLSGGTVSSGGVNP